MNQPLRTAWILLLVAGAAAVPALRAQTAQVRAKVSNTLPHYQPQAKIRTVLEILSSDALAELGEEWAKAFQSFQPEGQIQYRSRPVVEVVKALVEGASALVITGREITAEEAQAFQKKFGFAPMRIPICLDANIVFVHKNNPLNSITLEQLDAIYSRTRLGGAKAPIVVWGDLGVRGDLAKRPINAYARKAGDATRDSFAALAMLRGEFRPGILERDETAQLAEAILGDPAGIAFGPLNSWYTANKVLAVAPFKAEDGRLPTQEMVTSSRYPMPRLYYAYVNRPPGKPLDPALNEALHFMLSQEGQSAAADAGLLPGPVEFIAIALKRLER